MLGSAAVRFHARPGQAVAHITIKEGTRSVVSFLSELCEAMIPAFEKQHAERSLERLEPIGQVQGITRRYSPVSCSMQ